MKEVPLFQEHACLLPVDDKDDDVAMVAVPSGTAGRRGGVSAEVYREEDATCYVKKVTIACTAVTSVVATHFITVTLMCC